MNWRGLAVLFILIGLLLPNGVISDRMPGEVPENQVFFIDTLLDVTGPVDESGNLNWIVGDSARPPYYQFVFIIPSVVVIDQIYQGMLADGVVVDAVWNPNPGGWLLYSLEIPADKWTAAMPNTGTTYEGFFSPSVTSGAATNTFYGNGIPHGKLGPGQMVGVATWSDTLMTDGGHLSETKNFGFDSQNKTSGLFNLETEKVITYDGSEGSHLTGEEQYLLDIAGSYAASNQSIRCVFASAGNAYLPAFCNVVKATSSLINVNSVQVSTKGSLRMIGKTETPAALNYRIAVTPDTSSGSGVAEGTVATAFAGHIREARDRNLNVSADTRWDDSTEVTGGIQTFQKTFAYQSGFKI